jgi:DNA adenine methylase
MGSKDFGKDGWIMPNSLVKPYLKWAGGKRQLLPEIKKHLPKNFNSCKYYEPFVGAGAVFFEKQPKKAVINDYNTQLMLTYRVIRDNIDDLIEALRVHGQNNNEEYYYEIRSKDRNVEAFNALSNTEKAARLIFLNKTCYNGLYRVNSQGLFNAPYMGDT